MHYRYLSLLKTTDYLFLQPTKKAFFIAFFTLAVTPFFAQTAENCTNGIDDDGDGLIDCYDTDCTCTGQCNDFYYTTCNPDCYFVPPCGNISLGIQWTGQAETGTYSPIVAGDMDGDGVPEVVTYKNEGNQIYIADGATGLTKVTIIYPSNLSGGTAPAIADLDNDGLGELVIVGDDQFLRCYEHNGVLKYTSAIQVGYGVRYRYSVPNIADFNHDGFAEVNIGNQVYNGQTGALLASGGSGVSAGEHPKRRANNFSFNMPVPMDVLPDNFCPDCDGLEIVAGNQVLSVNLQTGTVTAVVTAPTNYTDGFTSVADIDRDGDLDAVVQGQRGNQNVCYAWDIQTPTILREFQLLNNYTEGASRVNIADLNGDGQLEVSFVSYPWLYTLRNNFTELWKTQTLDASAITCSSVFDFCGDGSADVVYRGQGFLQIIEGATGQVKWQDNCTSATHIENPLILDVDADGQTEVVIQCGSGPNGEGRVVCYEAVGTPGIASRKVWNQHCYFNTNINEDLSVPRIQQNPHIIADSLRMNTFLNQFFNPSFPSPDGLISFESVTCDEDSLRVTIEICNNGDNILPLQMPISAYRGNPLTGAAGWIGTVPLGVNVPLGGCVQRSFAVPRDAAINDTIYVALNDDHSVATPYSISQFPITALGECGFTNNFTKFFYNYNPSEVSLGNDTTICDNATVALSAAGNQLTSFLWQNGSTQANFTAPDAGVYAVATTDICGIIQRDTIQIYIDSSTVVNIGPDQTMCQGETVSLSESGFDTYTWTAPPGLDCTNCANVEAGLSATGTIILRAELANGCFSTDTMLLTVNDTFYLAIDTFVCENRTLAFNGLALMPNSEQVFNLQTVLNCDSTVFVQVMSLDTFATAEEVIICPGQSYTIFGQAQNTTGLYSKLFVAENGCDSTHRVNLIVQPQITVTATATPTCFNVPTGTLAATAVGGNPPFNFEWSTTLAGNMPAADKIPAGTYTLTVTDNNDCTQTATTTVNSHPAIEYTLSADSVQCNGQNNGQINIATNDSLLLFSLDDQAFITGREFDQLTAGTYSIVAEDVFGCNDTTEIQVFEPAPMIVMLPADTSLLLGDSIRLSVLTTGEAPLRLVWSDTSFISDPTDLNGFIRPQRTIRYQLTITDQNGCSATDQLLVSVERIRQVFVPNIFSSTADNDYNTRMAPGFGASVKQVQTMRVFDRWGNTVFGVENVLPGDAALLWDGRSRGKVIAPGVYVWQIAVELVDGTVERYEGDVTFIR
jgi:FG-GAP-like repeat/CHU_C Type IX secretion signal domain